MKCPYCGGKGGALGYVVQYGNRILVEVDCGFCDGIRQVDKCRLTTAAPDQAKALDFEDHLAMEHGDFSCCVPDDPPGR